MDYISTTQDKNITTGDRECFNISIIDDTVPEDVEQFLVVLDSPNTIRFNITVAKIEIVDDDNCKLYYKFILYLSFFIALHFSLQLYVLHHV